MAKMKKRELVIVVVFSLLTIASWYLMTSWTVRDIWHGIGYEPSAGVQDIHDQLELTDRGQRIFRGARPALEGSEAFNQHCDSHSTEVALLGCYTDGQIYVYEITNRDLVDANKVTMAHELLHAAWLRMDDNERKHVTELMNQVAEANTPEWQETELSAYDGQTSEVLIEEKYTRIGTKIRDLPEELERHYAKYFKNRTKIVDFYEKYQAPLVELKNKTDRLGKEILAEREAIAADRQSYETELENLNLAIQKFNNCASTMGCFTSDVVFERERSALNTRQADLDSVRVSLNDRIDQANTKLGEYQQNLRTLGELNDAMNSNAIENL